MLKDMAIMSRQLANYLLSHNCKLNKIVPHHNDKTKLVFYFEHTAIVEELMDKYKQILNLEKEHRERRHIT